MPQTYSRRWAWLGLAFRLSVATFVAAALGFPIFVWSLARSSSDPAPADAIVALTGGEGRLQAALDLLDQRKGARLLISGVHTDTTRDEVLAAAGTQSVRAACCVDLGRSAENTIGNAGETAAWSREHGYKSIIVVTASYHMPRSIMELRAVMPDIAFTAYPVFPDQVHLGEWWREPQTTGVLASEYMKYLAATVRVAAATGLWSKAAPLPGPATIENAPGDPAIVPVSEQVQTEPAAPSPETP